MTLEFPTSGYGLRPPGHRACSRNVGAALAAAHKGAMRLSCDGHRLLGSGAAVLPGGIAGAGADGADALGRLDVLHVLRRDPRGRVAGARDLGLWPRLRLVEPAGARA